jgi:uncharacterized protein (TIGR03437 family)
LIEPVSVAFDGKHLFVGDGALHRVLIWNSLPSSDGQPADAVLGQQNFASATNTDNPGPDTIDRPVALASDGTNLFVADAVLHRILVFTPGDFSLTNNALVNSASLSPGPVAPGTLVTITGNRLSEASESAPDDGERPLPHQLAGLEVFLDGVSLPLLSVSPDQIRAQIPYNLDEASSASLYIRTTHADGIVAISNAISVKLLPASPGLFAFAGTEPRTGMILRASANGEEPGRPVTSDDPARPGDVLIIWAAGLGAVDGSSANRDASAGVPYDGPDTPVLAPVIARLGGHRVQVISATLPHGAVGIYEIRVQVPRDFTPASMSSLVVSQNGQFSNTVTIPVEGIIQ